jgi:hypothetical protein
MLTTFNIEIAEQTKEVLKAIRRWENKQSLFLQD